MSGGVNKQGDWGTFKKVLHTTRNNVSAAIGRAMLQEGHALRRAMVTGITRQAPGGEKFRNLSDFTLAMRRFKNFTGTKALVVHADLRNAIGVVKAGSDVFVGVPRNARSKDGHDLVDVARIHEYGAGPMTVKLTPAMRRLFGMVARHSGHNQNALHSRKGTVVITIPARPFVRPAFKVWSAQAQASFTARMTDILRQGKS